MIFINPKTFLICGSQTKSDKNFMAIPVSIFQNQILRQPEQEDSKYHTS